MKRRFISFVLVLSFCLSLFVFVSPSALAVYDYNPDKSLWASFLDIISTFLSGLGFSGLDFSSLDFSFSSHGRVSYDQLISCRDSYNSWIRQTLRFFNLNTILGSGFSLDCEIAYDTNNGIYRLRDSSTGAWVVDAWGRFPYFESEVSGDVPDSVQNGEPIAPSYPSTPEFSQNTGNKWELYPTKRSEVANKKTMLRTGFSYSNLKALADLLNLQKGKEYTYYLESIPAFPSQYWLVRSPLGGSSAGSMSSMRVLCDPSGCPFAAVKDKNSSAANQEYHYYAPVTNNTDNSVDNSVTFDTQIQDTDNYTLNIPIDTSTSIGQYIESQYFDLSSESYITNTYDVTYNNEFNSYTTNYYTWNITYNISNTYVTYIGSNDAWQQEEYKFYYELPDGRSSADLTEDEVAALSFQFADCVNYARSATDINLRALYHFDGDIRDSGYFNDKSSFSWSSGASITYMDSSAFNGALYLDETAHAFTIGVPMKRYSRDDFTIQFRYYQAAQPDTVDNKENSLTFGSNCLLKWDERTLYNGSGKSICALPIGNWAEIALIRSNGTLYTYVNGLKVASQADSNYYLAETFQFAFGATSRAYSMLDELRILDFALAADGKSYTPTSVPYDTNLVLVLPDSATPILDTYWDFNAEGNLLEGYDFSTGDQALPTKWVGGDTVHSGFLYEEDHVRLTSKRTGTGDGLSGITVSRSELVNRGLRYDLLPLPKGSYSYVFSVMTSDGTVYSLPFTAERYTKNVLLSTGTYANRDFIRLNGLSNYDSSRTVTSFFGDFTLAVFAYADNNGLAYRLDFGIVPARGKSVDIVYAEVKQGTEANSGHERVTCAYSSLDLKPNTAAVHTDIPLHGYTVGGVRPTFPVRGDVWFQVSGRRITGVQVYNGQAWEASNARWWTGSRWIPIYAFDVFTLEDCWDIADTDDVVTQITTEGGFWNWWKGAWIDFRSWLSGVFSGGSDDPQPSPSPSPSPSPGADDDFVIPSLTSLQLAPYVTILRENAGAWSANSPTSVTVQMESGNLWQGTNTVHNLFLVDLLHDASDSDVIVSLEVSGLPVVEGSNWDSASLLLYTDDDNYISLGKKSHFDGFSTVKELNGHGVEAGGNSAQNSVTSATLVFCKSGSLIRVFAKPAYGSWVECASLSADISSLRVGFTCWHYSPRGRSVTFSDLRMGRASDYSLGANVSSALDLFQSTEVVPFFITSGTPGADDSTIFGVVGNLASSLWSLTSGVFHTVSDGVGGFFKDIADGTSNFFSAFSGPSGVFGYFTYEGDDIWD